MAGAIAGSGQVFAAGKEKEPEARTRSLELSEFVPTSMLQVHESHAERARFPLIDIHTHISVSAKSESGVSLSAERKYLGKPEELVAIMDRKNIRAMVNLTGGYGQGLQETVAKYDRALPGRFYTFTEPCYERWKEPNYPQIQGTRHLRKHRQEHIPWSGCAAVRCTDLAYLHDSRELVDDLPPGGVQRLESS